MRSHQTTSEHLGNAAQTLWAMQSIFTGRYYILVRLQCQYIFMEMEIHSVDPPGWNHFHLRGKLGMTLIPKQVGNLKAILLHPPFPPPFLVEKLIKSLSNHFSPEVSFTTKKF